MSGEFNASQGKPGFDWEKALSEFGQPNNIDQMAKPVLTPELSLSGINRGKAMKIVAGSLAALTIIGSALKLTGATDRATADYTEAESPEPVRDLSTPVIVVDAEQEDEIITTTTIRQTTTTVESIQLTTSPTDPKNTEIEIVGNAECESDTNAALSLIENETPEYFELVDDNIAIIECAPDGDGSGMYAFELKPRFVVGDATRKAGVQWYAGAIVHDAMHAEMYREYQASNPAKLVPDEVWTGAEAEADCLDVQISFLEDIDAPKKLIDYLEQVHASEYWEGDVEDRDW